VSWDDLDDIAPADFTVHTALRQLESARPWLADVALGQALPPELVEEGKAIPSGRTQAMQEGRRRARPRRTAR
jgi:bifunctional non-homologous end joining protein LigD